jgi:hypothetical protein
MATISSSVRADTTTTQVDVTIQSDQIIADPVTYVQGTTVSAEILARAGLSADLPFVAGRIVSSSSSSGVYTYVLIVTYGADPAGVTHATTGHTHDATTVDLDLTDIYQNGPTLTLDAAYGPMIVSAADDASVDYVRVRTDTATTSRDLFRIMQGSIARFGTHVEFYADATYDVGTPDDGATLRRPRDVRLSRDLYVGQNVTSLGYGSFASYVLGTHTRYTPQTSNPDNTPGTRHTYVNSVDNSFRFWDGASENILSGGSGTSSDTVGLYDCAGGISVGDAVRCTSIDTVVAANATTLGGNTIAGIVVDKPSATTCSVKYLGETGAVFGGALTPGAEYYVDRIDGGITDSLAAHTIGDTDLSVGFAKDTSTLVVRIGWPSVR